MGTTVWLQTGEGTQLVEGKCLSVAVILLYPEKSTDQIQTGLASSAVAAVVSTWLECLQRFMCWKLGPQCVDWVADKTSKK